MHDPNHREAPIGARFTAIARYAQPSAAAAPVAAQAVAPLATMAAPPAVQRQPATTAPSHRVPDARAIYARYNAPRRAADKPSAAAPPSGSATAATFDTAAIYARLAASTGRRASTPTTSNGN